MVALEESKAEKTAPKFNGEFYGVWRRMFVTYVTGKGWEGLLLMNLADLISVKEAEMRQDRGKLKIGAIGNDPLKIKLMQARHEESLESYESILKFSLELEKMEKELKVTEAKLYSVLRSCISDDVYTKTQYLQN